MKKVATLLTGLTVALSACGTQGGAPSALDASPTLHAQAVTGCSTTNLAQGKTATASSTENAGYLGAGAAVDNNTSTRWASTATDAQWLQVDLGSSQTMCGVTIQWEAAYAKSFQILISNDGTTWTAASPVTSSTGGTQDVAISGSGRYVRMNGIQRATGYGYSIFEFQVFGGSGTSTGGGTTTPTLPTSDTPDFGPNVSVFDPSTPITTIQSKLDTAFNAQLNTPSAQFGDQRNVFLFKPGTYGRVYANVGFYTTVAGLGLNPDDVTLNGAINVDSGWVYGDTTNATQNFWRSAENLSVVPEGGTDRWAVSQAAPMRRVHIKGNLTMGPSNQGGGQGYSSGGYIADSKVDGQVSSGSQQQWYTRDSTLGSWTGSNWNMVFSGVGGAPAQSFPSPAYTVLGSTPVSREKPYLYADSAGKYRIFLPNLRTNSSNITWPNTPGTSLPLSQFYVARPSDSTATLNQALSQGLNLFFTPGVYHLSQTLNVTRANTVIFGLGFATLVPDGGVNAMQVADVDGVRIAGLLFDAGTVNSPALLTVGTGGSHISHAANPTTVQDTYFRIGGAVAGKSTTSLILNSDNAIVDHTWAWRADHGNSPTGWTVNTADTGVIVNGNNVLATGLFVEHYQKYQVVWNGQNGKTVFFQNEMPYDVPDQATWRSGANGYAAYKVADSVTTHEAWGVGAYAYFNTNPSIHADRGFEVPNVSGVKVHDALTVSLGNVGTIDHVINNVGASVPFADPAKNTSPSTVVSYP